MKPRRPLTFRTKLGMDKVTPSRVRVVAQEHEVETRGAATPMHGGTDLIKNAPIVDRADLSETVVATVGDYALELVDRDGAVVGMSYLSGPAIQIVQREPAPDASLFREADATITLFEIEEPRSERQAISLIDNMRSLKLAYDFTVFEHDFANKTALVEAIEGISRFWHAIPKSITDEENRELAAGYGHLVGKVRALADRSVSSLHFQPPRHSSDLSLTPFQIEGLLRLAKAALADEVLN